MIKSSFHMLLNMRLFTIILGCFIIGITGSCLQKSNDSNNENKIKSEGDYAVIFFDKHLHEFGVVQGDAEIACRFGFSNKGTDPLIIQDVVVGCGCTDVKYPNEPIKPGDDGAIEIVFNTRGRNGHQRQVVKVISNGSVNPQELIIRAEIKE